MITSILAAKKGWGALALCGLLLFPLYGQDGLKKDSPKKDAPKKKAKKIEISPAMFRQCPALKQARGKNRKRLIALYFDLSIRKDGGKKQVEKIKKLFDLKDPAVNQILRRHLFRTKYLRCLHNMRIVFATWKSRGLLWLLKAFPTSSTKGQGRILQVVRDLPYRENYLFLQKLLDNPSAIRNREQSAIAPPGYTAKRLCDQAWKTLVYKLRDGKIVKLPKKWGRIRISPMVPLPIRNQLIGQLKGLLKSEKKLWLKFLKDQPSLLAGLPLEEKMAAKGYLKKLGLKKIK